MARAQVDSCGREPSPKNQKTGRATNLQQIVTTNGRTPPSTVRFGAIGCAAWAGVIGGVALRDLACSSILPEKTHHNGQSRRCRITMLQVEAEQSTSQSMQNERT